MSDALPTALRPVPVPSASLLARLAPLTPVPGRPDLVAHYAPDVFALWQAWEEECGAPQAVPFWAAVWPAGQLLARVVQAELARVIKAGTGIEASFKRGKGEAGMDEYQVRTWEGWHHHMVLSVIAVWFLIGETHRGSSSRRLRPYLKCATG